MVLACSVRLSGLSEFPVILVIVVVTVFVLYFFLPLGCELSSVVAVRDCATTDFSAPVGVFFLCGRYKVACLLCIVSGLSSTVFLCDVLWCFSLVSKCCHDVGSKLFCFLPRLDI